jgi:AcrR family transcriptional regulator
MARPIDPEKRPAILSAARAVFLEKGYAETRMSEIAARAGVAVGTVYLYFDSKESIARAMAESFYRRIEELVAPALATPGDTPPSPDRFRQLVHQAFTIAVEERELLLLSPNGFTNYSTHDKSKASDTDSFLQQMGVALATLMAAGWVRRYEDPVVLAELIVTLSQPVIRTYITLTPGERERYEAIFAEFVENALIQSISPSGSLHHPDPALGASTKAATASHTRVTFG